MVIVYKKCISQQLHEKVMEPEIVEHFYGVYLLNSLNIKHRNKIYIGYTVNPCRRIKQHNSGRQGGGAVKTSKRGPWKMLLIVHGFPNNISALKFEWAWQHHKRSRRLKHVPGKKSNQTTVEYHLMILSEMLQVGPWCRLPLVIRWLDYEYAEKYTTWISAPLHMPICYGKVKPRKIGKTKSKKDSDGKSEAEEDSPVLFCSLCFLTIEKDESVSCINPNCSLTAHLICLARKFSKDGKIVPIEGTCPSCSTDVLWGDLIRKMVGCYQDLQNDVDDNSPILISDDDL